MKEFDNIIGYGSIKNELERICDMMRNPNIYKELGASIPSGIILHGSPGVGKTLFANCFLEASGRKCYICRKNLPDGEFIKLITSTFEEAKENQPSIILLDDIDKFANEDKDHKNAEEYITVQSCIDDVKGLDVFVIATANDLYLIPDSLLRAGRFDTSIKVENPKGQDAVDIIKHYLSKKNYVADIDTTVIAKILNHRSCAELESIINQAGIYAGYKRKNKIEFVDIIDACKRVVYDAPETIQNGSNDDDIRTAYHEAGHAIISELLEPQSVTLISIGGHEGNIGGFTAYYRDDKYWTSIEMMENRICALLGGKAATEIVYGKIDTGCSSDLVRALEVIQRIVTEYGGIGLDKCTNGNSFDLSNDKKYYIEHTVSDELERYYKKTKELLIDNRKFLDMLSKEIENKKTLVASDIEKIKKLC